MLRFTLLATALVLTGCSKKDDKGGGGGGGTGGAAKSVKLDKMGLSLEIPGETLVSDAIMGDGQMINGSAVGAMQVEVPKEPLTLEAAKEDASMYSPQNLKEEKLADGWALTFQNKGSMGTNHWVTVNRTLDGKNYKCWYMGPEASQAANVLAACKTLKKG